MAFATFILFYFRRAGTCEMKYMLDVWAALETTLSCVCQDCWGWYM